MSKCPPDTPALFPPRLYLLVAAGKKYCEQASNEGPSQQCSQNEGSSPTGIVRTGHPPPNPRAFPGKAGRDLNGPGGAEVPLSRTTRQVRKSAEQHRMRFEQDSRLVTVGDKWRRPDRWNTHRRPRPCFFTLPLPSRQQHSIQITP